MVRVRTAFLAGMADERRAVFAEGVDSIVVTEDAAEFQMGLCGFVASNLKSAGGAMDGDRGNEVERVFEIVDRLRCGHALSKHF